MPSAVDWSVSALSGVDVEERENVAALTVMVPVALAQIISTVGASAASDAYATHLPPSYFITTLV